MGLSSATPAGGISGLNASSLMPLSANQVGNPAQPGGGAYPSSVPLINLMSAADSNYNSNGTAAGADESMQHYQLLKHSPLITRKRSSMLANYPPP
jgi:hypothetical protein